MARGITGATRATSGERSTTASGVMAPMVSSPFGPDRDARVARWPSLRRLTSRVGRNTPAFIISISAVPPAIGRTDGSSGSSRAMASRSEVGSSELERGHGAAPGRSPRRRRAAAAANCRSISLALARSTGWPRLPSLPVSAASIS